MSFTFTKLSPRSPYTVSISKDKSFLKYGYSRKNIQEADEECITVIRGRQVLLHYPSKGGEYFLIVNNIG
jgi:hypothetical protein